MKNWIFSLLFLACPLHAELLGQDWLPCYDDGEQLQCWNHGGWGFQPTPRLGKVEALYSNDVGAGACAVDEAGVHCWGAYDKDPIRYDAVTAASYGADHVCYLQRGQVSCFGIDVPRLDHVLAISSYNKTFCALDEEFLRCFGAMHALIPVKGKKFTHIAHTSDWTIHAGGADAIYTWWGSQERWTHLLGTGMRPIDGLRTVNFPDASGITCYLQDGRVKGCPELKLELKGATDVQLSRHFGYCYRVADGNHCFPWNGGPEFSNAPGPEYQFVSLFDDGSAGRICFASSKDAKCFAAGKGDPLFVNERTIPLDGITQVGSANFHPLIRHGRRDRTDYKGKSILLPLPEGKPRKMSLWHVHGSWPEQNTVCGVYGDDLVCSTGSRDYGWQTTKESVPGLKDFTKGCKLFADRIDCGNQIFLEETFPGLAQVTKITRSDAYELCAVYADRVRCWNLPQNCAAEFALDDGDRLSSTTRGRNILYGARGVRSVGFLGANSCATEDRLLSPHRYDQVLGDTIAVRDGVLYVLQNGEEAVYSNYLTASTGLPNFARGLKLFRAQVPAAQRDYVDALKDFLLAAATPGPVAQGEQKWVPVSSILSIFLVTPYLGHFSESHRKVAEYLRQGALGDAWKHYKVRWEKDLRRLTGVEHIAAWRVTADFLRRSTQAKAKVFPEEPLVVALRAAVDRLIPQLAADIQGPANLQAVRLRIAETAEAYRRAQSHFENHDTLRGQVGGDLFALWYLEGI